ncbi:MAG: glycosyltransferase family 2 protein [Thaumarchaeota archaeon]|nr:glycosyltransferase family 2 protein [Nitrososphaerota archaeon]
MCTRNSAATLERCLRSVFRSGHGIKMTIIDQSSVDDSVEIARRLGAEVVSHDVGLGYARQLAFDLCKTKYLAFVDSDEEIIQPRFFDFAIEVLDHPTVGAVVGMSVGHRFAYGLPMGLLVLRTEDFQGRVIPSSINAREEFYVRRKLRRMGLSSVFVSDVMVHRSQYRRYKPEWEGANTRVAAGVNVGQLVFTAQVVLLQSLNSRSPKNIVYAPLFYLKFLKGFVQPERWRILKQVN